MTTLMGKDINSWLPIIEGALIDVVPPPQGREAEDTQMPDRTTALFLLHEAILLLKKVSHGTPAQTPMRFSPRETLPLGAEILISEAAPPAEAPKAPPGNFKPVILKGRDGCVRELGYAWIYMKYLRPGWLDCPATLAQKKRVKILMMECAVQWHRKDDDWWDSFYDRIEEEIENMC